MMRKEKGEKGMTQARMGTILRGAEKQQPVPQGYYAVGPAQELRMRILSIRLFPNLYNKHFVMTSEC
jgi:hypothetical protein